MRIRVKRGLNLEPGGAPGQQIHAARSVRTVALVGRDYPGLKPTLAVSEGDRVSLGQTLYTDRRYPDLRFAAPAAGRVRAINRGARRRLVSVVIDVEDDAATQVIFDSNRRDSLTGLQAERVRGRLLESGLWTALRARPFGGVPPPASGASAILVTAMDTNPHAAEPGVVLEGRADAFADGVAALSALTEKLYVCKAPELALPEFVERAKVVEFAGPHPAGLPGTHIAHLAAASQQDPVWHIGYQDVIAIGELFVSGRLSNERVVAVGGPGAVQPRLLRTRIGASLEDLLHNETKPGARAAQGSVFSGHAAPPETAWLGRYDTQISVFDAAALPFEEAASRPRGMIPVEAFERAWPFDSPVLPLLRALLVSDYDTAQALGCLDLTEEDLAVCSYLCPARQDYGTALRTVLNEIESGSAA